MIGLCSWAFGSRLNTFPQMRKVEFKQSRSGSFWQQQISSKEPSEYANIAKNCIESLYAVYTVYYTAHSRLVRKEGRLVCARTPQYTPQCSISFPLSVSILWYHSGHLKRKPPSEHPNTWFSTFRETKNLTILQPQSLWEALRGSNLCDLWQSWPRLASCHSTFGREMSRVRCCVLSDRLSSRRQPARENCQTSHLLFHRNDTLTIYHISSDTLYS